MDSLGIRVVLYILEHMSVHELRRLYSLRHFDLQTEYQKSTPDQHMIDKLHALIWLIKAILEKRGVHI